MEEPGCYCLGSNRENDWEVEILKIRKLDPELWARSLINWGGRVLTRSQDLIMRSNWRKINGKVSWVFPAWKFPFNVVQAKIILFPKFKILLHFKVSQTFFFKKWSSHVRDIIWLILAKLTRLLACIFYVYFWLTGNLNNWNIFIPSMSEHGPTHA